MATLRRQARLSAVLDSIEVWSRKWDDCIGSRSIFLYDQLRFNRWLVIRSISWSVQINHFFIFSYAISSSKWTVYQTLFLNNFHVFVDLDAFLLFVFETLIVLLYTLIVTNRYQRNSKACSGSRKYRVDGQTILSRIEYSAKRAVFQAWKKRKRPLYWIVLRRIRYEKLRPVIRSHVKR